MSAPAQSPLPEDAEGFAVEIFPDEPLLYSMFDESVGEFDRKDVRELIRRTQLAGFGGAVHPDYSSMDNQEDAFSLCVFNPQRDVRIVRDVVGEL